MQIFSKLRTYYSSRGHSGWSRPPRLARFTQPSNSLQNVAGFTLIELMISIAIITVITSIVLVRFGSFDSTVVLKNKAYETGLLLRELQVESVSVRKESNRFDYPFGMSFVPNSSEYTTFQYSTSSPALDEIKPYPKFDPCAVLGDWDCSNELEVFNIGPDHEVSDICYTVPSGGGDIERCASDHPTELTRLDISFKRPEFNARMFVEDTDFDAFGVDDPNSIINAKVKIGSIKTSSMTNVFVIEVSKLGQISIYNE